MWRPDKKEWDKVVEKIIYDDYISVDVFDEWAKRLVEAGKNLGLGLFPAGKLPREAFEKKE